MVALTRRVTARRNRHLAGDRVATCRPPPPLVTSQRVTGEDVKDGLLLLLFLTDQPNVGPSTWEEDDGTIAKGLANARGWRPAVTR